AGGRGAFEHLAGQPLGGRRHGAPLEADARVHPYRLVGAREQRGEVVLDQPHQARQGQAIGGAELAQHAGGGTDGSVLQPRQRGAADLAAARQLIERPAALGAQGAQALGDLAIDRVGGKRILFFHIRDIFSNTKNKQAPPGCRPGGETGPRRRPASQRAGWAGDETLASVEPASPALTARSPSDTTPTSCLSRSSTISRRTCSSAILALALSTESSW